MAVDYTKARLLQDGNLVTPKGRIVYPALFTPSLPKGEKDQTRAKYQATLLLPKAADVKTIQEALRNVSIAKWGPDVFKKSKIKLAIAKTEDEPRYAAYAEDFPWFIRTNSKDAPGVVLADRSKAKAEDGYGGRWAALCVNPYAFEHPTGGKFANLGLVHAQLLDHDEPIGRYVPAVDDVFEAVEGDGSDIFA